MKIFRKSTPGVVKDEQIKHVEQSYDESESIPVFKGQGKRKGVVQDKGKVGNASKYGKA